MRIRASRQAGSRLGGAIALLALGALALAPRPVEAELIAAVGTGNGGAGPVLLTFDSATPGDVTKTTITGLGPNFSIAGIDYRATDGKVYLMTIGNDSLYTLDLSTGAATLATVLQPPTGMATFNGPSGFDFDPTTGLLHLFGGISSLGNEHLIIDPATGQFSRNADFSAFVSPLAFSNDGSGATTATLYGIDRSTGLANLVRLDPITGAATVIGPIDTGDPGTTFIPTSGLDISSPNGIAYTVGLSNGDGRQYLATIDLATGATTVIGSIATESNFLFGNLDSFTVVPTAVAVPEPSSLALLGLGIAGPLTLARRWRAGTVPRP